MADLVGRVLAGRYELSRVVLEGDDATLYEAVQLDVRRRVSVKVLAHERDASDGARLRHEAHAMATIDDPHVASVLEVGGDGEIEPTFVVMERFTGETLEGKTGLPAERAVRIGIQLAHAVGAAHAAGIIHRDVRPSNVMIVRTAIDDSFVKLTGFGLAKTTDDDARKTGTLVALGRRRDAFVPPEGNTRQAAGPHTDIFGVGACLDALLGAVRDPSLAAIVRLATAADPKARFGSASELEAALREWKPAPPKKPPSAALLFVIAVLATVACAATAIAIALALATSRTSPPATAVAAPLAAPPASAPPASAPEPTASDATEAPEPVAAPSSSAPASASVAASAAAAVPTWRPSRGMFYFDMGVPLAPPNESEAWRARASKAATRCVESIGVGECPDRELQMYCRIHPSGTLTCGSMSSLTDEERWCQLPAPLVECLERGSATKFTSAKMPRPNLQYIEWRYRLRRAP